MERREGQAGALAATSATRRGQGLEETARHPPAGLLLPARPAPPHPAAACCAALRRLARGLSRDGRRRRRRRRRGPCGLRAAGCVGGLRCLCVRSPAAALTGRREAAVDGPRVAAHRCSQAGARLRAGTRLRFSMPSCSPALALCRRCSISQRRPTPNLSGCTHGGRDRCIHDPGVPAPVASRPVTQTRTQTPEPRHADRHGTMPFYFGCSTTTYSAPRQPATICHSLCSSPSPSPTGSSPAVRCGRRGRTMSRACVQLHIVAFHALPLLRHAPSDSADRLRWPLHTAGLPMPLANAAQAPPQRRSPMISSSSTSPSPHVTSMASPPPLPAAFLLCRLTNSTYSLVTLRR